MAARLKYVVALIATCVAAAVLVQAWERPSYGRGPRSEEGMRARAQVNAANMQAHRLHREYMVGDSLMTRMPASTAVVVEQSPQTYESVEMLRALVDLQMRGIPAPRARIGVFVVDADYGAYHGGVQGTFDRSRLYFTGVDANGPYCFVAIPLPVRGPSTGTKASTGLRYIPATLPENLSNRAVGRPSDVLGPCELWAKHGAPGNGVDRWLRQGGYRYALSPASLRVDPGEEGYRQLFGLRSADPAPEADHGIACRAGDRARCVAALRLPHRQDGTGLAAYATDRRYAAPRQFGMREAAMVAELEKQFGAAAFARFWQSDAELEAAFAHAFGVPAGEWVMQWARNHYGTAPRGPKLAGLSVLITLATLLVLAGLAVIFQQRRSLG